MRIRYKATVIFRPKLVISVIRFASTIFLSAFLLFQVQPLMGKFILPWFGGTPGVWTTCMLFFQLVLLGGYLYPHVLVQRLSPRLQGAIHLGLLGISLLALPVIPSHDLRPSGDEEPIGKILVLLALSVGLPFFVLSTTGPLLQRWFAHECPGRSPYWLYALSNAGSLVALISYPFFIEPLIGSTHQAYLWSVGYVGFVVLGAISAARAMMKGSVPLPTPTPTPAQAPHQTPPTLKRFVWWTSLAACASVLLLAITNQLCTDIAVIPLLWVVPLSVYLMTFIVCFSATPIYNRDVFAWLWVASIFGLLACLFAPALNLEIVIPVFIAGLFVGCTVCHGELYATRPAAEHLTLFYLALALGGALGGIMVGILAPILFPMYLELPLALVAGTVMLAMAWGRSPRPALSTSPTGWRRRIQIGLLLLIIPLGIGLASWGLPYLQRVIHIERNFFGVLWVMEVTPPNAPEKKYRQLVHGTTIHGAQYLNDPRQPLSYFSATAGAGLTMRHLPRPAGTRRIGVVGLGVGTLTAYAEPGDYVRLYEIDPKVERIAREKFSYLADCRATTEVVMGDARLQLEQEPSQQFDVLFLDAFNSDSVPTHLLSREAMGVYLRHLRSPDDGVIVFNISNRYLDLRPVIRALANEYQITARCIDDEGGPDPIFGSSYVVVSRNHGFFAVPQIAHVAKSMADVTPYLWTDDFSNLFSLLR